MQDCEALQESKMGKLEEYNKISQNQIDKGILEKVPQQQSGDIIHHINHQDLTKQLFKNMQSPQRWG